MIKAVLFDLDGTLADTALDLGFALNAQRSKHGLPPLPHEQIRPYASHGSLGLLAVGFGLRPEDRNFERMRTEYLDLYTTNLCRLTRLFDGMADTLDALESKGIAWGVVTNKPARFTNPLMTALGLSKRAASIISGDSCAHPKPHPEPLLCASREMSLAPQQCAYIGDAERDMEAAKAADMLPIIARWGYLGPEDHPERWGAQGSVDHPAEILRLL